MRKWLPSPASAVLALCLTMVTAMMLDRGGFLNLDNILTVGRYGPGARASQGSCVMPTTGTVSGLTLVTDINTCLAAVLSSHSGATAPANGTGGLPLTGQPWLDTSTTPPCLKLYDGTNWNPIGCNDASAHLWTPPVGGGGNTVASAGTTDLWSVKQSYLAITGTTGITSFASSSATNGTLKVIVFTGALTITHNATSLILPGGVNITTVAGDYALVLGLGGSNVAVVYYSRASAILNQISTTQGQVLYRGASNWAALATGTAGQLLSTNGAGANPSWLSVSAPALLNTLTASTSASLSDTTSMTATYSNYELIFQNIIPATNGVTFRLTAHSGGSFQSSSYVAESWAFLGGGPSGQAPGANVDLSQTVGLQNTGNGFSGRVTFFKPSQTASPKHIIGTGAHFNGALNVYMLINGYWNGGNGAVDGFQVVMSSGNITSGTILVYGLPCRRRRLVTRRTLARSRAHRRALRRAA